VLKLKPCNPKRSFPFTETRQPGRAAGPMPSKPFIDGRYSFCFDVPRRPWPSLRRYCPRSLAGAIYLSNVVITPSAMHRLKLSSAADEQIDQTQSPLCTHVSPLTQLQLLQFF
jgi:hypothetical protein